jgi:hypothetical protein
MCRGGKDGVIKRCKVNDRQQASANLRKKVKYRADKEGISPEEWKEKNSDELSVLVKESFPVAVPASFQSISETRRLADGIPESIAEHIEMSRNHIESTFSTEERKALSGYTGFGAGTANAVLLKGKIEESDLYDLSPPSWREHSSPPCDFHNREDLHDYLETMDNILANRQEEQRVLYRGIPIYRELQEEFESVLGKKIYITDDDAMVAGAEAYYQPGKILDFKTYVSTTHSAYYAGERTQNDVGTNITYWDKPKVKGIVFEMKTNAGLDVTGVARNHSYEREVVLPRDTRFRVESVNLRPDSYDTVSGYDHVSDPEEREEENFTNLAVVVQLVEVDKDGNDLLHTESHKPSPLVLG